MKPYLCFNHSFTKPCIAKLQLYTHEFRVFSEKLERERCKFGEVLGKMSKLYIVFFFFNFIFYFLEHFNPSFTKPFGIHTLYQGEGRPDTCYLKNCRTMGVKFCRVLDTPLKVLEMLKLFTWWLLGYHSNSSISAENTNNANCCQIHNLKDYIMKLF